mmetsp:Transcript_31859/g.74478  ORF Transcript_31859/g.74478 Transcript_31859/m.74478 type:complete len:255 (-) Transcript_31859:559-1323(-)
MASCTSFLTRATSLSSCEVRFSCTLTTSVCFLVLSSVLITARLMLSRSRMISTICLLSVSTCFLSCSISRTRFSKSLRSMPLATSMSCLSLSSKAFRRCIWSIAFCALSNSIVAVLISSCFAFSSLLRAKLSSAILSSSSLSSLLACLTDSMSPASFVSSVFKVSTVFFFSLRVFSRRSFSSSWALMSVCRALQVRFLASRVVFRVDSSFSRRSRRLSSLSASVRLALSISLRLAISTSPWSFSDSWTCTSSVS